MEPGKPYFSIILPVFNRAETISVAIRSVLTQSFANWELIIVDDFSTDSTVHRIKQFSDSRIKLISNPKNMGPGFSRNIGINLARGEVISFLDSDDSYFPEFLEKTSNAFKSSEGNAGFSWTGLEVKYPRGTIQELWVPKVKISPYYTFLKQLRIGTNSGFSILRKVFDQCGGFNESLMAAEDTEFLLRIVRKFDFVIVEETLIHIDKSGRDRLSLNYNKIAYSYNQFIDQHWDFILKYPELKQKFFYKLMWLNYHLSDYEKARLYFRKFKSEFGLSIKITTIFLLFELFGSKIGSKIHVILSR